MLFAKSIELDQMIHNNSSFGISKETPLREIDFQRKPFKYSFISLNNILTHSRMIKLSNR